MGFGDFLSLPGSFNIPYQDIQGASVADDMMGVQEEIVPGVGKIELCPKQGGLIVKVEGSDQILLSRKVGQSPCLHFKSPVVPSPGP